MRKIILGTAQFGLDYGISNSTGKPERKNIIEILDYAFSKGILTIDTADSYGNAHELLGDYNQRNPGNFSFNTKFIRNSTSFEDNLLSSLESLQVKSINTYYYHRFSDYINHPELLESLRRFKQEGYVKKIGLSIYDNKTFLKAIESDEIDVIQFPFNLLDNRNQRGDLIILAKERGKELHARSVFLQGLFFLSQEKIPKATIALIPYLRRIKGMLKKHSMEIYECALRYVLAQSEIDYILVGVDNLNQLKQITNIEQQSLGSEIIEEIDQLLVHDSDLLYPINWERV